MTVIDILNKLDEGGHLAPLYRSGIISIRRTLPVTCISVGRRYGLPCATPRIMPGPCGR